MAKCNRLGCLTPSVGQGRCAKHGGEDRKQKHIRLHGRARPDYHKLYATKGWASLRLKMLAAQPLCQRCKQYNIIEPGVDVDHVISHKGDTDLFYNRGNLQVLCRRCHSWKTQREGRVPAEDLDFR